MDDINNDLDIMVIIVKNSNKAWKLSKSINNDKQAYKYNTRPNCTQIINEWQNKNQKEEN